MDNCPVDFTLVQNLAEIEKAPATVDYVRPLRALLDGLSKHAFEGSADNLACFRAEIAALSAPLSENLTSEDLELIVSRVLVASEAFNRRSRELVASQVNEFRSVIENMTNTITFLSESRTTAVHQLLVLGRELVRASQLDDVRQLRGRLQRCLDIVRDEATRLQGEAETGRQAVAPQGERPQASLEPHRVGALDPVTGLPGRAMAERMICDMISAKKDCLLAVFLVDRITSIRKRHGKTIEDEALLQVAHHLTQGLPIRSSLCRWNGPAFAAFMEAPDGFADLKRSWLRLATQPLEKSIESPDQSVLLYLTTSVMTSQLSGNTVPERLFRDMDHFVASRASLDRES